jgi:hypothetical protein
MGRLLSAAQLRLPSLSLVRSQAFNGGQRERACLLVGHRRAHGDGGLEEMLAELGSQVVTNSS